MKNLPFYFLILVIVLSISFCKKEHTPSGPALSTEVKPININNEGAGLLENLKGHWVGSNQVLSWDFDWFAFDYRPISESHIFGIYEGGSQGNLFTSFFVTDYKNTRTIMARNGGLLGGIYRTSYFVLDSVKVGSTESYYRLIDAVGGSATMYMELVFSGDDLNWNVYTSRLAQNNMPTRHMTFSAKREHVSLANTAANAVNFPSTNVTWDFSDGFNSSYLYDLDESTTTPKSATFAAETNGNDVYTLASQSGDPFIITDHPYLATLRVDITKNTLINGKKLFLYLSKDPLTDNSGIMQGDAEFNTVLQFPELDETANNFTFTYLHPGEYYITVIADANDNGYASTGDVTHVSQAITVNPNGQQQVTITNINVQN